MVIIKKIIPFEKELLFKTKVCEITSISLEHTIDNISEDLISGNFHINGDYKMTEGSINREKFDYNVSFDIALDSRYDTKNMVIDIDDFTYRIINDEVLKVRIELFIEGDILIEENIFETKPEEIVTTPLDNLERQKEKLDIMPEIDNNIKEEDNIPLVDFITTAQNNNTSNINTINIFGNIDNSETYATYKIYIVKEEDTIEKIMEKYNVDREMLISYNNIENIIAGDKIIIPTVFNE